MAPEDNKDEKFEQVEEKLMSHFEELYNSGTASEGKASGSKESTFATASGSSKNFRNELKHRHFTLSYVNPI
ncbi:hypothetical protein CCACVL1_14591 [Corchorus capsularis]|uniref:Uncharacterized protein n=1 Tax=Corchorus capsularis TaxID=210143 RepID=A0A1R3I6F3_COCAP|nr:hypothetical protein CCACVL1_14591 [Corchorus capsularis]